MKKFPKEKCRFDFLGVSKKGPSNGIIAFPEEVTYYIIIVDVDVREEVLGLVEFNQKKYHFQLNPESLILEIY